MRDAFLNLANENDDRFVIVDATLPESEIANIIHNNVAELITTKDVS